VRPDICVSGINHGGNLGDDATYSGTVAGALEATILGVKGLAFSLVAREEFDFTYAAEFAIVAVRKVLQEGLPEGTLLNINFPPGPVKGTRVTRQGIKTPARYHRTPRPARQSLLLDRRRTFKSRQLGRNRLPSRRARLCFHHSAQKRYDRSPCAGSDREWNDILAHEVLPNV
jgi:broad specificity polyphosphatase/5'/3'-nucleotidase SurE